MIRSLQLFVLTFALSSGLFFACGSSEGEASGETTDTLVSIDKETDPDVYAANEMADDLFGKKVNQTENPDLELPETNVSTMSGEMPGWLEAIISRESIVLFANGILSVSPDEAEFAQQEQVQYETEGGMKGFHVRFTTRPNNYTMAIYGIYTNQDDLKWATFSGAGDQNFILKHIKEGPEAYGSLSAIEGDSRKSSIFHTTWTESGINMAVKARD